jgi:hypothetical protein
LLAQVGHRVSDTSQKLNFDWHFGTLQRHRRTQHHRRNQAVRGVRILCDFLTIHGFLTKEGAQYALAPDSALYFLNQYSPTYIGTTIEFLLTPRLREGHARLAEAVSRGVV